MGLLRQSGSSRCAMIAPYFGLLFNLFMLTLGPRLLAVLRSITLESMREPGT